MLNDKTNLENSNRLDYLDSARGIASMMVVLGHFVNWRLSNNLYVKIFPLSIINGADAVSFFFVLSGFVLSYKYIILHHEMNVKVFLIKRFFRLYPGFVVAVLSVFLYYHKHGILFSVFKELFYYNKENLWWELALLRDTHYFYVPGWTLSIEMGFSFMMPIFILCAQKDIKAVIWFVPLILVMGNGFISGFAIHFCLGTIAAFFYHSIRNFDFSKSKFYKFRYLIYLVVIILIELCHIDSILHFSENEYCKLFVRITSLDFFHFNGLTTFLILIWIINSVSAQNFLNLRPLIFIGKISYGLYLIHWVVVIIIMDYWDKIMLFFKHGYFAYPIMLCVEAIVSIILATLIYYFIEKPCIRFANKITAAPV